MAQDNGAKNLKRQGTGKTTLALIAIGIAIIALIGLLAWVLMNPEVLQTVVWIVIIAVAAIALIVIIVYAVIALLAIPMYVVKGEQYQDGVDYNLDDVKPVKESSSEDKKNE